MRATLFSLLLAVVVAAPAPAAAQTAPGLVEGPAIAVDGDTLKIGATKSTARNVRLFGIDAPERRTRLGPLATAMLDELLAGRSVSCTLVGKGLYREDVGRCAVAAGAADLGLEMVRAGWAAADRRYTTDYDAAEREARAARRGLWADLPVGERERGWYEEFKDWVDVLGPTIAIVVGALLGFWGVIRRQKADAGLARDQRRAEENRETLRRQNEARSLASVLHAEITVLSKAAGQQHETFQKFHDDKAALELGILEAFMLQPPEIYHRHADRLTLLPGTTAQAVVAFYVWLGRVEKIQKQITDAVNPTVLKDDPWQVLAKLSGDLEEFGDEALAALDAFLAGKPPPELELGAVKAEAAAAPRAGEAPGEDD